MKEEIKEAREFQEAVELAAALTFLWLLVELIIRYPVRSSNAKR